MCSFLCTIAMLFLFIFINKPTGVSVNETAPFFIKDMGIILFNLSWVVGKGIDMSYIAFSITEYNVVSHINWSFFVSFDCWYCCGFHVLVRYSWCLLLHRFHFFCVFVYRIMPLLCVCSLLVWLIFCFSCFIFNQINAIFINQWLSRNQFSTIHFMYVHDYPKLSNCFYFVFPLSLHLFLLMLVIT